MSVVVVYLCSILNLKLNKTSTLLQNTKFVEKRNISYSRLLTQKQPAGERLERFKVQKGLLGVTSRIASNGVELSRRKPVMDLAETLFTHGIRKWWNKLHVNYNKVN